MGKVEWEKRDDSEVADVDGFELTAWPGDWMVVSDRDRVKGACLCGWSCGRCFKGTAKSQKKARKAAVKKWREIVGAEKAAQVKPEPEPVPVDAPTRLTVEIVRPERKPLRRRDLSVGDLYRYATGDAAAIAHAGGSAEDVCLYAGEKATRPWVDDSRPVFRVNVKCEGGRIVGYEDVEPGREVPVKQIAQGEHYVYEGRVYEVEAVAPEAKYVAWVDLESGKAGTIYHLAMVEPCTIERTERIVATVTT